MFWEPKKTNDLEADDSKADVFEADGSAADGFEADFFRPENQEGMNGRGPGRTSGDAERNKENH